MTQNQLIELFETDQLRGIVERSEERGWVDPAELEAFATEHELADDELEQVQRELEAMGLEIGAPQRADEEREREEKEAAGGRRLGSRVALAAPPTRSSSSSPTSASTSC